LIGPLLLSFLAQHHVLLESAMAMQRSLLGCSWQHEELVLEV